VHPRTECQQRMSPGKSVLALSFAVGRRLMVILTMPLYPASCQCSPCASTFRFRPWSAVDGLKIILRLLCSVHSIAPSRPSSRPLRPLSGPQDGGMATVQSFSPSFHASQREAGPHRPQQPSSTSSRLPSCRPLIQLNQTQHYRHHLHLHRPQSTWNLKLRTHQIPKTGLNPTRLLLLVNLHS
jgi:hypothetical protein